MKPADVFDLLDRGWAVLPVKRDKKPLVHTWKQYQNAPPSRELVERWAKELRPPVWAGITGTASGRFTLDFDGPEGAATLEALCLEPHRRTPSGGYHVDFAMPAVHVATVSCRSKRELAAAFPGMDVRGDGGYSNLLGTTDRGSYEWLSDDEPLDPAGLEFDLQVALGLVAREVPEAGLVIAPHRMPSPVGNHTDDTLVFLVHRALQRAGGGRNDTGFWLACQLRDHRVSHHDATIAMSLYANAVPPTNAHGHVEPYTDTEALASLRQAYGEPPRAPFLPVGATEIIVTNRQLAEVTEEAVIALDDANDPPSLFLRGGRPVRILQTEHGPRIDPLDAHAIRHHLGEAADWFRLGDNGGPVAVNPPVYVSQNILAMTRLPFPILEEIIAAPTLRPDGSVLSDPGYDAATKLYFAPADGVDVSGTPQFPSADDLDWAVRLLRDDFLGEFAFADEPSRANALGLLLSLCLRPAINALLPLALIDAPVAGTGKSILTSVIAVVATGRPANFTTPPDRNDEELRKRLTSLLLGGANLVVFGNASGLVQSPVLAQVLTADVWSDRVLGVSKMAMLPQRATWALTGNNIQLGGDLHRRCYVIRLDPKMAQPWHRQFRRPDLLRWAADNRSELLRAALVIGRAWFAAGCRAPAVSPRPWGTYHEFQRVVGGMLAYAGVAGFLDNLESLQTGGDREGGMWAALLSMWQSMVGERPVRTRDLLDLLDGSGRDLDLPATLANSLAQARSDQARATRLSGKLEKICGRRFDDDGIRIESAGFDGQTKTKLWRIVSDDAVTSAP